MNSKKPKELMNLETDIVVVGAGGAGMTAAVVATEKGANVSILEKRRKHGGITAMAGGLFAAESPLQKRLRCDIPKDEIFKMYMEYGHWKANARVARAYINKSGDTIQWLADKGVVFSELGSVFSGQFGHYPPTFHWIPPKQGGAAIVKMLKKECDGLGIQMFYQSAAKRILTDGDGCVEGLHVETKEGETRITAKVVIIATGGYGGNKEMLKKYYRNYHENMVLIGPPHMGDGIQMAMEIGAATDSLGTTMTHGPMCPGFSNLDALARQPETLWVNKNGERFADETVTFRFPQCGNVTDRQPEGLVYSLFDNTIKEDRTKRGISTLHADVVFDTPLDRIDENIERAVKKGMAKKSDSLDDIAAWMGASPQVLKSEVDAYNNSCDNNYDNLFNKDRKYLSAIRTPPFYGVKSYPSSLGTTGGIKINERMEALDHQGLPIPGLYVLGNDAGGWISDTYNLMSATGSAFGFAINSGRIAGENAAVYVAKK